MRERTGKKVQKRKFFVYPINNVIKEPHSMFSQKKAIFRLLDTNLFLFFYTSNGSNVVLIILPLNSFGALNSVLQNPKAADSGDI